MNICKTKQNSGIYLITNIKNNYVYIGSCKNIKKRFANHRSKLNRGVHENYLLQKDFLKYGKDNFTFTILLNCDEEYLQKHEEKFFLKFLNVYNIQPHAGSNRGNKHREGCKLKVSMANSGTRNGNAKLTIDAVLEIRKSSEKGIILSKKFNVSTSQISMVKNNKSYKNI